MPEVAPEQARVMSALVTDYTGGATSTTSCAIDGRGAATSSATRASVAIWRPTRRATPRRNSSMPTRPTAPPPFLGTTIAAPPPPPPRAVGSPMAPPRRRRRRRQIQPSRRRARGSEDVAALPERITRRDAALPQGRRTRPIGSTTKCKSFLEEDGTLRPPSGAAAAAEHAGSGEAAIVCPGGGATPSLRTRASRQPPGSRPPASRLHSSVSDPRKTRTSPATCGPPPPDEEAAVARLRSEEEAARGRRSGSNRLVVLEGFRRARTRGASAIDTAGGDTATAAALVLVYPAEEDGGGGRSRLCPGDGRDEGRTTRRRGRGGDGGRGDSVAFLYVVGSTNTRSLPPPEHADLVVASLKKCWA